MKKIFSLIVACAALFAACETDPTGEGTNNGGNNNGGENNNDGKKTELAAPAIEIKDVTSTSFTVTWAAVENAESYMVTVGDAQPVTITETSYKVENLNAGTYSGAVIAVAAKDSNYTNSKASAFSQDVTGLTPEECDWFECAASLPTEDMEADGYFPFYHILTFYRGTGVVDVRGKVFDKETYGKTPVADLAKECDPIDSEYIDDVNSADGLTLVYTVDPDLDYIVVIVAKNEAGLEVIYNLEISTTEVVPIEGMDKWVGMWNLTSEQAVNFTLEGEGDDADMVGPALLDEAVNTPIQIIPALAMGRDIVAIYGLSTVKWDDGTPMETFGKINAEGQLEVLTGFAIAEISETMVAIWVSFCDVAGELSPVLADTAWIWGLSEDGQSISTVELGSGLLSDEVTEYEFRAMEVVALDTTTYQFGFFYDFVDYSEVNLPAGAVSMVRMEDAPATQSATIKGFSANNIFASSMVVRM